MTNPIPPSPRNRSEEQVAVGKTMRGSVHNPAGGSRRDCRQTLEALTDHFGEDAAQFDAPRARALFETAAEVLAGLHTAFAHYPHAGGTAPRE